MKINPHATVVPFIVMVDRHECASIEDLDVRKHDQYNYFLIVACGIIFDRSKKAAC